MPEKQSTAAVTKRVLIVVSTFEPAISPDMHRARLLGHELPKLGWEVEILTPGIEFQRPTAIDRDCGIFFNHRIPVHTVAPWQQWLFRLFSMESPGWRAWWPLFRQGSKLLRSGRFDLIYFSTTHFPLFCLGPLWWRLFKIPYVLDFQDPWHSKTPKHLTTDRRLKWKLSNWIAPALQRFAIGQADALIAVSPKYLDELRDIYPGRPWRWLAPGRCEAIPFSGSITDVEATRRAIGVESAGDGAVRPPPTDHDGRLEIVYVGAGAITRLRGWEALCAAATIVRQRNPQLFHRFRVRLYGTTGHAAAFGSGLLQRTAEAAGLPGFAEEFPDQVGYFRSLELASRAAGLLILGVDDPAYTPSKLFSYLLFDRPVLAVCHSRSPAAEFLGSRPDIGHLIDFDQDSPTRNEQWADSLQEFMQQVVEGRTFHRAGDLAEHLPAAMARRHVELFNRCIPVWGNIEA